MPDLSHSENEREILTNADIKTDLKKELSLDLVTRGVVLILLLPLVLTFVSLRRQATDQPLVFWWVTLLLGALTVCAIVLFAGGIVYAVTYLRALYRDRFHVTDDKLIDKTEGRQGRSTPSFTRPAKPHIYRFTGGTYKTPVNAPQCCHSKRFAMSGNTLFRRSEYGDRFFLVSLKRGKPILIYPADRFDYRDTSPL